MLGTIRRVRRRVGRRGTTCSAASRTRVISSPIRVVSSWQLAIRYAPMSVLRRAHTYVRFLSMGSPTAGPGAPENAASPCGSTRKRPHRVEETIGTGHLAVGVSTSCIGSTQVDVRPRPALVRTAPDRCHSARFASTRDGSRPRARTRSGADTQARPVPARRLRLTRETRQHHRRRPGRRLWQQRQTRHAHPLLSRVPLELKGDLPTVGRDRQTGYRGATARSSGNLQGCVSAQRLKLVSDSPTM